MFLEGKIEFLDPDGERFAITVYGCTDNSIMTNYPFTEKFSKSFAFLNIEGQAIKYLNKDEIDVLTLRDTEYRECFLEYHKESERIEQDSLLGKMAQKSSKDSRNKNGAVRSEPTKPMYMMGQSSAQYSPDFRDMSHTPSNSNGDGGKDSREIDIIAGNNSDSDSSLIKLTGRSGNLIKSGSNKKGIKSGNKNGQLRNRSNDEMHGSDVEIKVEADNWKNDISHYIHDEAFMLLTWLNKFVCRRQFNAARFPDCVFDSHGDIFVEFIEQVDEPLISIFLLVMILSLIWLFPLTF